MQMWELFWVYNLNKHSQGNPSSRVSHFTMKNFGCCHHGCLTVSLGYPPQRRLRQRVTFLAQIWSPLGQVKFIFTTSGKSRKRIWKQCSSSTLTMFLFYIFFCSHGMKVYIRWENRRTYFQPSLRGKHHVPSCSTNVASLGNPWCNG